MASFKWCKISLKGRKVNSTFDCFWGEPDCLRVGVEACIYRLLPCSPIGAYVCVCVFVCVGVCICPIDLDFWSMNDDAWTCEACFFIDDRTCCIFYGTCSIVYVLAWL